MNIKFLRNEIAARSLVIGRLFLLLDFCRVRNFVARPHPILANGATKIHSSFASVNLFNAGASATSNSLHFVLKGLPFASGAVQRHSMPIKLRAANCLTIPLEVWILENFAGSTTLFCEVSGWGIGALYPPGFPWAANPRGGHPLILRPRISGR